MTRESTPVHISEILPGILSQLKHTSKVKSSASMAGEAQSSIPGASPPPTDRESELTVVFGILTEKRKWFATVLQAISVMELPGTEYLKLYVQDMHRRNCKPGSMLNAVHVLKRFLSFLSFLGRKELEELTRADLEVFVEHEQDRGMKLTTVSTYLGRIHAFLHFLIEEELISPEVLRRKLRLRLPQSLPKAMDPDDVRQLLSGISHLRDRAMILLLLRTGMRIGELLATKLRDVNLKERTITIWEGVKNRRGRVVYFSDDARDVLRKWLEQREAESAYLFYGYSKGRLSYNGARLIFKRNLFKVGLADKGYTLHCLRHTFASEILNGGMRIECLQELLGHDKIEITRRYARLTNETRREEYFRAMAMIERGEINGSYQLHRELQTILKEKELLASYDKELSPQS
jgi:site-specific recombinase XerD